MTMPENSTINWKDLKKRAEDATRPPEPGWYVLECTKAELGNAASSGNPMIKSQFKIVEGPAAGKSGIFNNFNLTVDNDFAMSVFFRHMAAFGFDEDYFNSGPSLEQLTASLVGRRANVQIGHHMWQGAPRAQFEDVRPLEGALPVPVTVGPSIPVPGAMVSPQVVANTPPVPTIATTPQVGTAPAAPPSLPF